MKRVRCCNKGRLLRLANMAVIIRRSNCASRSGGVKISIFWVWTQLCLSPILTLVFCLVYSSTWRRHVPPKRRLIFNGLYPVISQKIFQVIYYYYYYYYYLLLLLMGARGSVVGWGTMLQAGRSRVRFPMRSLDFLIVLILAALWPWGRLSL
jgi:hypothetical protein